MTMATISMDRRDTREGDLWWVRITLHLKIENAITRKSFKLGPYGDRESIEASSDAIDKEISARASEFVMSHKDDAREPHDG